MGEKKIVLEELKIKYDGLFNAKEVYKLIDNWLKDNGYDKKETLNSEHVTPSGRNLTVKLDPYKSITDYAKIVMKIKLEFGKCKDVEVNREGHKVKMNEGSVSIKFKGVVETDREGQWQNKPILYFIRTIFDKYVYKVYANRYEQELVRDINLLAKELRSYLNMQQK